MISNRLHLQIGLRSLTSPVVISTLVPPDQVCLSIPTAVGPNSRSVCLSIACRPLLSVAMGEFCEIRWCSLAVSQTKVAILFLFLRHRGLFRYSQRAGLLRSVCSVFLRKKKSASALTRDSERYHRLCRRGKKDLFWCCLGDRTQRPAEVTNNPPLCSKRPYRSPL